MVSKEFFFVEKRESKKKKSFKKGKTFLFSLLCCLSLCAISLSLISLLSPLIGHHLSRLISSLFPPTPNSLAPSGSSSAGLAAAAPAQRAAASSGLFGNAQRHVLLGRERVADLDPGRPGAHGRVREQTGPRPAPRGPWRTGAGPGAKAVSLLSGSSGSANTEPPIGISSLGSVRTGLSLLGSTLVLAAKMLKRASLRGRGRRAGLGGGGCGLRLGRRGGLADLGASTSMTVGGAVASRTTSCCAPAAAVVLLVQRLDGIHLECRSHPRPGLLGADGGRRRQSRPWRPVDGLLHGGLGRGWCATAGRRTGRGRVRCWAGNGSSSSRLLGLLDGGGLLRHRDVLGARSGGGVGGGGAARGRAARRRGPPPASSMSSPRPSWAAAAAPPRPAWRG